MSSAPTGNGTISTTSASTSVRTSAKKRGSEAHRAFKRNSPPAPGSSRPYKKARFITPSDDSDDSSSLTSDSAFQDHPGLIGNVKRRTGQPSSHATASPPAGQYAFVRGEKGERGYVDDYASGTAGGQSRLVT